jgi:hypothetical protein
MASGHRREGRSLQAVCRRAWISAVALSALVVGVAVPAGDKLFPDVLAARIGPRANEIFDFDVTVSSPYDTPQRYADGFRVATRQGQVLGERKLLHDHQGEQPFTRDLYGVRIPKHVRHVVIQARDQINGYGGAALDVALPGR